MTISRIFRRSGGTGGPRRPGAPSVFAKAIDQMIQLGLGKSMFDDVYK